MNVDDLTERVPEFEDALEPLGVLAGGFLVLVGLASLVGMPWRFTNNVVAALLQTLGSLATVVVGLGIAWIAQTRREELPFR